MVDREYKKRNIKVPNNVLKLQRAYPGSLHCVLKTVRVRTIT